MSKRGDTRDLRRPWGFSRFASLAVLLVGIAIASLAYVIEDRSLREQAESDFRAETEEIAGAIEGQVAELDDLLVGVKGLFDAGAVSNEEFEDYVSTLLVLDRYPGVSGIAWTQVLPTEEVDETLAALGIGDPINSEFAPGQRDVSYVLTHGAPAQSLAAGLGLDIGVIPTVADLMEDARDEGRTLIGPRFSLASLSEDIESFPATFFIASPHYVGGGVPDTVEERRESIDALPGLVVVADEFLAQTVAEWDSEYEIELFDGPADGALLTAAGGTDGSGDSRTIGLPVLGHVWTLRITQLEPVASDSPVYILVVGILLSAMLAALFHVLTRSELRALRMVDNATEELSLQERHFRALVANSNDLVVVTDEHLVAKYVSPAARRLLDVEPDDLVGESLRALAHPDGEGAIQGRMDTLMDTGRLTVDEFRLRRSDGVYRWFEATGVDLRSDPAVKGIVWTVGDITERRRFQKDLAYQARHDYLTGLPNRNLLIDRLGNALARSDRTLAGPAVLFVDLDHFKNVNDSLGHSAGDDLLRVVAERFTRVVRPGDTVARFGGDEFVVLAEDVMAADECAAIADRLAATLTTPMRIQGHEVFVRASIGMVLARPGATAEELLRDADIAMYRAKEQGRGRSELFDEQSRAGAMRRLTDETALRRAVERNEFVVHYQPQYDLSTGRAVGVEALVRWQQPERGLLLPGDFINLAEESGLIGRIGEWVLGEACRQGYEWLQRVPADSSFVIAVNLSASQLAAPDLVDVVSDTLRMTGLAPDALCLEITEGALMQDITSTVETLSSLRSLGVRLAIDDFGTGYASLGHLKCFPVDYLKIDRSFVNGLGQDPEDTVIVAAVIGLAHALGVTAIAEGLETDAQLAELRALGCDSAQGWLFAPALPVQEVAERILSPVAPTS